MNLMIRQKNISLSTMMFFQYMMLAVWWLPLAAYLVHMGLTRNLTAFILSSMAFGSFISPLVGMLADRYFKAQYLLASLNFLKGIMLLSAAMATNPIWLFVFLLLAMFFYMPTWTITSSITLSHIPNEQFSKIRVFGTIGWIMAGVFSLVISGWLGLDFDGTHLPFLAGAALSMVAAISNLFLPDTPPVQNKEKSSLIDIMGFRSLVMLRDKNFTVLITVLFLSMLPFSMYWSYFSEYLAFSGYRFITITMNIGQIIEMFVLLTVPVFIRRFGLRNTLMTGLIALVLRYVVLYLAGNDAMPYLVFAGVGLHGIIFGYFFLAAQIYTANKAPLHLKSQAQGLIFFVTFAIGLLTGNFISGWIIEIHSFPSDNVLIYNWIAIWGITALQAFFVLVGFLIFFRKENDM
jgi:nucleoside transporter